MAVIWDERNEVATTGYEETWSLGNATGGGSAVNAAIASSGAGSPFGWATQCMRLDIVAANNCYRGHQFAATPISYVSFDAVWTTEALADSGLISVGAGLNGSAATNWIIYLTQTASVQQYAVVVAYDGSAHTIAAGTWPVSTVKRFEIFWDNTNNLWAAWVDSDVANITASGTLTGTAATSDFVYMIAGNALGAGTSAAATVYEDLWIVDNAARANPGYGITQRNTGVSRLAGAGGLAFVV